jgi:hypothetical protein
VACHNDATFDLSTVSMPSGVTISDLGNSAICMQCHQGRESTVSVNVRIAGAEGVTEEDPLGYGQIADIDADAVNPDLGFANIHYYAAAATLFGSETHGGYEYAGQSYQIRNGHVEGYTECVDCHNPHTLELKVEECAACHEGVASAEDFQNVRMNGSLADFDGDGDTEEGTYSEVMGVHDALYAALTAYAADMGAPIAYDAHTYPYFFNDLNSDGEAGADEANFGNGYASWTPRLLQAAYNYQVVAKDPGGYAHNGKYLVALMYDSIQDLGGDVTALTRNDAGHFDGAAEAFRHWDEEGEVPGSCSRCHSAEGLPLYLEQGVAINQEPANGFKCSTCHNDFETFGRFESAQVTFPSGAVLTFGEDDAGESNLCMNCHQGRESTVSVNNAINAVGVGPDTVDAGLRFRNVHYFAAGATLFGTDAKGAYEYAGKTYVGQNEHVNSFNSCAECHDVHELRPKVDACAECHDSDDPMTYRIDETDWDGDGDTSEGVYGEIATMEAALLVAMQDYAANTAGTPLQYNAGRYPYFFSDLDGNGKIDGDDAAYASFTPKLVRATYNYQYAAKDTGGFAHNPKYVMQVIYDSIQDMGGDVSGMTRP